MVEQVDGEGGEVPSQVWDALFGVAAAAADRKQGREAIAGLARQLSEVPGCELLAMRLSALAKPNTQVLAELRGWVGRMWRAGKLTEAEYWAAQDIGRGVEQTAGAAADGLRAIDPSRLVVDGGPLAVPSLGGACISRPEAGRVAVWRADVRSRPAMRSSVRGRERGVAVDDLVLMVLVEGKAPMALDVEFGLKHGRAQQAVLSELRAYVRMHFSA